MAAPLQILCADWVAPMSSPIIEGGAVAIQNGRITDLGAADEVITRHPDAPIAPLKQTLLMPGLVNAHVHLELSDLLPGEPPNSFVDWLLSVISNGPTPTAEGEARAAAATAAGIAQCLRFGVTTVGDITRFPHVTRAALAESPLRAVSFGEVTAMASRRHLLEQRLASAMELSPAPERIIAAVSPHAPYSIEGNGYRTCVKAARKASVPVASHVSETRDEATFLTTHSGPFRQLWSVIGGWDERVPCEPPESTAMSFAAGTGLLAYHGGIIVHANYAEHDLDLLAASRASVVFCPRTHAYFQHPPHQWQQMLAAGVNVAVGTDSTASSPNLNLLDDLRLLHRQSPQVPVATLWQLATTNAAKALMMGGKVGQIAHGAEADLIAFEVTTTQPLAEILDGDAIPTEVWIAGQQCGAALS